MIDYCTLTEVKSYITSANLTIGTADDPILQTLISEVSREIDGYCDRYFFGTPKTYHYDAILDVNDRDQILYLNRDLQVVTALINGDGSTIDATDYILIDSDELPAYAIRLKRGGGVRFTYDASPEQAIQVVGTWGYVAGTVPPQPIQAAAVRLVQWRYALRDAPFEQRGLTEDAVVDSPTAMPNDVKRLLSPFVNNNVVAVRGLGY